MYIYNKAKKRYLTEWEKLFIHYSSVKRLTISIRKGIQTTQQQETNKDLKEWQRT